MPPTRQDHRSGPHRRGAQRSPRELVARPVTDAVTLDELLEGSLPAFGGAFLRRVWQLLDEAIGKGLPMTISISGPVTVSGQHYTWLGPLLETGWFCMLSTTDAVCYHDGHRALDRAAEHPFHEVEIFGDDGALRDERTIRVTDVGFDEELLLDQDRYLRALLREEEFQRRMTGPEFRRLLGLRYAELERRNGVREGLLALCARKAIPIFVGAPADGSVFLNSMALWALREANPGSERDTYRFELDLHGEVFESCAYHRWGIRESDARALGTLVLGGGVPKNFNLQPEPALSQILGFEDVQGYLYDIQLTTAPVTDGSLSSCPPGEAVTWGKVEKEHYRRTTESMQVDYSIVMPILVKALLEKRARLERLSAELGEKTLFERHPQARGYLRDPDGYRLLERREELIAKLLADVARATPKLRAASRYPLPPRAPQARAPRAKRRTARRKTR
ncbi:MAG TPA: deoxyhypusine synthase family protein [Planctomycetota bacterium]|nr:deoxyhypusine synthase family protein [Planctomycetota bacterium]